MKVDIREYYGSKKDIIRSYEDRGLDSLYEMCAVTSIPLIAALKILEKKYPQDKLIKKKIKTIVDFFEYSEIIE